MSVNDRIKEIRKHLKLSQTVFGEKLGVGRGVIANLEMNITEPKELFIDLICNTFNVSHEWLKTGEGEMFTADHETIVDKLIKEYDLDDIDESIIKSYLNLSGSERSAVKKYITSIADRIRTEKITDKQEKSENVKRAADFNSIVKSNIEKTEMFINNISDQKK